MNTQRREILKTGGGVTLLTLVAAAGWLKPGDAALSLAKARAIAATATRDGPDPWAA